VVDATFVVAGVRWDALGSCNDSEGGGLGPGGVNGDGVVGWEFGLKQ
jgi:hypothetical protein